LATLVNLVLFEALGGYDADAFLDHMLDGDPLVIEQSLFDRVMNGDPADMLLFGSLGNGEILLRHAFAYITALSWINRFPARHANSASPDSIMLATCWCRRGVAHKMQ